MQLEIEKETNDCSNLDKLRDLIQQMELQPFASTPYSHSLNEIQKVISSELKIINNLKQSDSKIKHYETICRNVLAIISSAHI
jgi:hypothetical protein